MEIPHGSHTERAIEDNVQLVRETLAQQITGIVIMAYGNIGIFHVILVKEVAL
jgi:hypothetical protein